jgi:tetratricopeptide (TPR) repeat protein
MMHTPEQTTPFLAEAYHTAALSNINMRLATEALETLRITMLSESDLLIVWDAIDAQVNLASDIEGLQSLLIRLREDWRRIIFNDEYQSLKSIFDADIHSGWVSWLKSFSSALAAFRLDFCKELCEASLPFPENVNLSISQIHQFIDLARHARWAETFVLYTQLGKNEAIFSNLRAKLLSIAAEIAIHHFFQYEQARVLLEQAQGLDDSEWRIKAAWAEYYEKQSGSENQEKAKERYLNLIDLRPDVSFGYTGIGKIFEEQNDFSQAEIKYQKASKCLVSPVDGYSLLLQLYGQKDLFEDHKNDFLAILNKINAVALSDGDRYEARQNIGYAYQKNNQHEEAHCWYQNAIKFDSKRLSGYIAEGYLYLEDENFEHAIEYFQQAINVAPESMEGYWGLSWVTEEQKDLVATLYWCQESLERRPEWGGIIHARMGNIKQQQNQREEAIEEFFTSLKYDAKNEEALIALERIATEYYQKDNDSENAFQIYHRLREAVDSSYEPSYRNRLGNLNYYLGKYQDASVQYQFAIAAAPENPRFYSNLALAIERFNAQGHRIEELDNAIANAQRACELKPDFSEYRDQLERLLQTRSLILRYGEQVLTFEPVDKPIRIHVQSGALPLILNHELDNLSDEFSRMVEDLRQRIHRRYGLTIPGLTFTVLEGLSVKSGEFQIDVMGEKIAYGKLELDQKFAFCSETQQVEFQFSSTRPFLQPVFEDFPKGFWLMEPNWEKAISQNIELVDVREYFLRNIEFVLINSLNKLCGHQETANLLDQYGTDACIEFRKNPYKLNLLTKRLKNVLKSGNSIVDLTPICEEVNRLASDTYNRPEDSQQNRPASELTQGIISLTLYLSNSSTLDRESLKVALMDMQAALFDEMGVVIPQIFIEASDTVEQDDFQLQINDQKSPITVGLTSDELWVFVSFNSVRDRFPDGRASIEPNSGESASVLKVSEEVLRLLPSHSYAQRDSLGYVIFCIAAELRRNADELLTREIVEYFLLRLKTNFPDLINVALDFWGIEELTRRLREQLRIPSSIKNMPVILETLLCSAS